jgi:hypothetical protein
MKQAFGIFGNNKGVVMMEFIVVLPIYLFLWGLLYIVGEVALMNDRILQIGRFVAYVESPDSDLITRMWHFLLDADEKDYKGYFGSLPSGEAVPVSLPNADFTTANDFASFRGSYVVMSNVQPPPGIRGMLALPGLFAQETPDPQKNSLDAYVHGNGIALGSQSLKTTRTMHWSIQRFDGDSEGGWHVIRPPMWMVVNEVVDGHYKAAQGYLQNCFSTLGTPIVMDKTTSTGPSQTIGDVPNYNRILGTFFSAQGR